MASAVGRRHSGPLQGRGRRRRPARRPLRGNRWGCERAHCHPRRRTECSWRESGGHAVGPGPSPLLAPAPTSEAFKVERPVDRVQAVGARRPPRVVLRQVRGAGRDRWERSLLNLNLESLEVSHAEAERRPGHEAGLGGSCHGGEGPAVPGRSSQFGPHCSRRRSGGSSPMPPVTQRPSRPRPSRNLPKPQPRDVDLQFAPGSGRRR